MRVPLLLTLLFAGVLAAPASAQAASFEIDSPTVVEGDSGTTNLEFTVTLRDALAATPAFTVEDVTTSAADHGSPSPTSAPLAQDVPTTVTVPVNGDTVDEASPETLKLKANDAVLGASGEGTGSITDDDDPPTISVDDPTVAEDAGNAGFKVSLSAASEQTVTVSYATADGSAKQPGDYTAKTGTVTFAPGDTEETVSVPVTNDTADEPNETFKLTLADTATNATVAANEEGTATITDDDSPPSVTVDDLTVAENDPGGTGDPPGTADFKVKLSAASEQTVTVGYATANGTAGSGDYTAKTGTVTFAPGDTEETVSVPVTNDTADEPNETFKLTLADTATNATVAANEEGTATITDDDSPPSVTVDDLTVAENDPGGTGDPPGTADFKVKLSAASGQTVTVGYATANGTAGSGDYTAKTGTVTFAPGDTEETVSVPVTNDTADEPNETFKLTLADTATNATVAANEEGTATITDDDGGPTVTVDDAPNTAEGNSGVRNATFKVKLSAASGQTVTVGYATADGTAGSGDYTAKTGTVTFAPGDVSEDVPVEVKGDLALEPDERFRLTLNNSAQNATVAADEEAQATILNDDPANGAPVARFTPNPPRAFIAKGVLLDGRASSDPEHRPLSFAWDLDGNGSHETPTGSDPLVITAYCVAGTHSLGLKVTDAGSVSDPVRRSSTTKRTVDAVQASPDNSCDQVAPALRISRISRSLQRALRRNLAVRLRCSEACTMVASAGVNRRTGRRLGLRGRRRTLGKAGGALLSAGSKRLRIKFSRLARRKLRRVRSVRVTLRFTVKDPALNALTLRRTIVLRR